MVWEMSYGTVAPGRPSRHGPWISLGYSHSPVAQKCMGPPGWSPVGLCPEGCRGCLRDHHHSTGGTTLSETHGDPRPLCQLESRRVDQTAFLVCEATVAPQLT